jgi:hypothetical protein
MYYSVVLTHAEHQLCLITSLNRVSVLQPSALRCLYSLLRQFFLTHHMGPMARQLDLHRNKGPWRRSMVPLCFRTCGAGDGKSGGSANFIPSEWEEMTEPFTVYASDTR